MCGINGLISGTKIDRSVITDQLSRMNGEIIHRGPDQDGVFVEDSDGYSLGMAMRRLSIIDLKTGEQPMSSEDGKISLVYNGEIYNFHNLKRNLIKKGYEFQTTSDTEVILKLYEEYHTASFSMLEGMFAFSIYDRNLNRVFIARDFFGEKPLYYTQGKSFVWASELKSIMKVIDHKPEIAPEGLNLFFQLTYIPAPFTIYKDIFKLEANHYLEYNCENSTFQTHKIQQNFKKDVDSELSFDQAKDQTDLLVRRSVEQRSISDVPLGTFLSGGVDSSIISLCLAQQSQHKIDTFSIGFEKKSFDESEKSRKVAALINSNHHEFTVSEGDLKDNMDAILLNFDEPFADSSSLATYLVAHKTRQEVKVALTGDGGDEVFGGYNKYYMGKLNNKFTAVIPQSLHKKIVSAFYPFLSTKDDSRGLRFRLKRLLKAVNYEDEFYYNIISLGFQDAELKHILKTEKYKPNALGYFKNIIGKRSKTLTDFRQIDKLLSLEGDMLVKVDRTSMLTSLESRAPFLDKQLWNFTNQLPENYLMKGWNKKYLLKESFKDHFPEDFLDKPKKGFGVPVGDWLRGYLKKELKSYTEDNFIRRQNIFNPEQIQTLVYEHIEGKVDNTFRVWTFFCFQKWYKNTFTSESH